MVGSGFYSGQHRGIWLQVLLVGAVLSAQGLSANVAAGEPAVVGGSRKTDVADGNVNGDDSKDQARQSYAKGQQAFVAKDFDTALSFFLAAQALLPHPTTLKMIAECHVQLGDVARAVIVLESLQHDETYTNAEAVKQQLAELLPRVAVLEIETRPVNASIRVNGEMLSGTSPVRAVVNPGMVEVESYLDGYEDQYWEMELQPGATEKMVIDFADLATDSPADASPEAPDTQPATTEQPAISSTLQPDGRVVTSGELPKAFWAASAVAGIGLVSGMVFGTMALRDEKDFQDTADDATRRSGKRAAVIADVSFGVALGAAVAATIVLISEKKSEKKRSQQQAVSPTCTRRNVTLRLYPSVDQDGAGFATGISF